jgi:hypothetical protein
LERGVDLTISKGVKYFFGVIAIVLVGVIIWGYLTGGVLFLASASVVIGMFLYMIFDSRMKKRVSQRIPEAKFSYGNYLETQASNLERAGRFEEAALIYERLHKWDKAGEMRKKAKTVYHEGKNVNINLDIDKLLQHIREKGITIRYSCPNCGASTKIDRNTSPSNLRICMYCKQEFEVIPLAEFLDSLLR